MVCGPVFCMLECRRVKQNDDREVIRKIGDRGPPSCAAHCCNAAERLWMGRPGSPDPPPITRTTRGRLRRSDRDVLDGILWVLRTGAQEDALPKGEYPPKTTCHNRFQE